MKQDYPGGYRENWEPGERAFFEYHCNQAHDSAHAQWWYRSHQYVTVLQATSDASDDIPKEDGTPWTFLDRGEAGCPVCYLVRFSDGEEAEVFEDELLTSSRHKDRTGFFGPPSDWCKHLGPMSV